MAFFCGFRHDIGEIIALSLGKCCQMMVKYANSAEWNEGFNSLGNLQPSSMLSSGRAELRN